MQIVWLNNSLFGFESVNRQEDLSTTNLIEIFWSENASLN